MSIARHHADWLSLIEVSGPFVSLPVVQRAFPHGLPDLESGLISEVRAAYADWQENGSTAAATHAAWVQYVLQRILGFAPDLITSGQTLPPGLEARVDTFHETLRPDFAILPPADREQRRPVLLVRVYPPQQRLESPLMGVVWKASPAARMMELLHATDLPLGLVTNGEEWQLVFAPKNESTGFASWFADLWLQEPVTLRAFQALLGQQRFFGVADEDTPAALLKASLKDQHEVTDSLGAQVRQAVELLVRDFDRLDIESSRVLLAGLPPAEIYNASLTVMMRLVFLFCAEERGLLRLGEAFYDTHYAVSTLRQQLREIADQRGEEVLERRSDAWCRLLATFRAVHGGVAHDAMRLPAYGGTLFDPDRYPFLEGRAVGTRWRGIAAQPPQINNRVVLHLLEALQILRTKVPGGGPAEARRLSFRSLDIEQIGHVYEGLLDHTARRAEAISLGLEGSSKATAPLITLAALEALAAKGNDALLDDLEERTGRSRSALEKALGLRAATGKGKKKAQTADAPSTSAPPVSFLSLDSSFDHSLAVACQHDPRLATRVRPFAGLLRRDSFDQLVLIQDDSLHIAPGSERRSTGTHYTPRTLTEPIVQHTLEPLVYTGPAEGLPQSEWKLKSPQEVLALKVCDMAMGSGAFLVQTCRYLAERLVEAWDTVEKQLASEEPTQAHGSDADFPPHHSSFIILPDGNLSRGNAAERLLPADPSERIAIARRYVADRCLYGVDINPMAVEMAKLSLWLITLQRDRPFTFIDHALKCGDSLLGISKLEQIDNFTLRAGDRQVTFATANLFRYVEEASDRRRALEDLPSNDHTQIATKTRLHTEAEAATAKVKALADCLIAFELRGLDGDAYEDARETEAAKVQMLMKGDADASLDARTLAVSEPSKGWLAIDQLSAHAREQSRGRRPFHWPVEFPEVFARCGFDGFIGNPPFVGNKYWGERLFEGFQRYAEILTGGRVGKIDVVALFFRRAFTLMSEAGRAGLIATTTAREGTTLQAGFAWLSTAGELYRAESQMLWPGIAGVHICIVWFGRVRTNTVRYLDGKVVQAIPPSLSGFTVIGRPYPQTCAPWGSQGSDNSKGEGFLLVPGSTWFHRLAEARSPFLHPYLTGEDITNGNYLKPPRWCVDCEDFSLEEVRVRCPETYRFLVEETRPRRTDEDLAPYPGMNQRWWQMCRHRASLYRKLRSQPECVAFPMISKHLDIVVLSSNCVFTNKVCALLKPSQGELAVLLSSIFESWIVEHGGTMRVGTLKIVISTTIETFPYPEKFSGLECVGDSFYNYRDELLVKRAVGLTTLHNSLHDPTEKSEDIARLRALHVEMDQAVAAAYGWSDLDLGHGFHPTKQGERYTLSETARRTVLDRLLTLNHQRYEEELKAGLHEKKKAKAPKSPKSLSGIHPLQPDLLPPEQPELF